MKPCHLYGYIVFGIHISNVTAIDADAAVHGEGNALAHIDAFLAKVNEFSLPVTQQACSDLVKLRADLSELDADSLMGDRADDLLSCMRELLPTLRAESQIIYVYEVQEKRVELKKLINAVKDLLPDGIWGELPSIAKVDFEEAGKCIAFERATAAAFHLLRGTEEVLKHFYRCYKRQNRLSKPMWGPMTEELKRLRRRPSTELLDNLDNIRRNFRNPTQHPEKSYSLDEAQNLFALCVDVISRMISSERWETPSL